MVDHNISTIALERITLSKEEFVGIFPILSTQLIKLTDIDDMYGGTTFETGFNASEETFRRSTNGGIKFTYMENLPAMIEDRGIVMEYCRTVTLLEDSKIFVSFGTFYANKVILGEIVKISDLPIWSDREYCLKSVNISSTSLKFIKDLSEEIQLAAVRHCSYALYKLYSLGIPVSEEVQFEAIKWHGIVIETMLDLGIPVSEEMLIVAVKSFHVIRHLLERNMILSEKVQLSAVTHNGMSLEYLLKYKVKVSDEVKIAAIKNTPYLAILDLIDYNIYITEEMQLAAIEAVRVDEKHIWMFDSIIRDIIRRMLCLSQKVQLAIVRKHRHGIIILKKELMDVSKEVKDAAIYW